MANFANFGARSRAALAALLLASGLALMPVPSLASGAGKAAESDLKYIEFAPFSVSVIQNNRVSGFLSVAFGLRVNDGESAPRIEMLAPRISNAGSQMLSRIARNRLDVARPINLELIRAYLQLSVDNILGKGVATVLIQDATLQPS